MESPKWSLDDCPIRNCNWCVSWCFMSAPTGASHQTSKRIYEKKRHNHKWMKNTFSKLYSKQGMEKQNMVQHWPAGSSTWQFFITSSYYGCELPADEKLMVASWDHLVILHLRWRLLYFILPEMGREKRKWQVTGYLGSAMILALLTRSLSNA